MAAGGVRLDASSTVLRIKRTYNISRNHTQGQEERSQFCCQCIIILFQQRIQDDNAAGHDNASIARANAADEV